MMEQNTLDRWYAASPAETAGVGTIPLTQIPMLPYAAFAADMRVLLLLPDGTPNPNNRCVAYFAVREKGEGGLLCYALVARDAERDVLAGGYDRIRSYVEQWTGGSFLPEAAEGRVWGGSPSGAQEVPDIGLPEFTKERRSQIIRHIGYTTSYNAETKIPNYVAWTLTPERFEDVVSRTDKFLPDPEVADPVTTDDYRNSGYDRGHMCPAADNKWDKEAMRESFYMTNVCPQHHNLNRGDWKELEDACREWAQQEGRIYIACGPIFYKGKPRTIGQEHKVAVPDAFFKVVLCADSRPPRAIGFIYKNTSGNHPLDSYVNTVDQVERITGMDFFPALPDDVERRVEANCDLNLWEAASFSKKRK